MNWNTSIEQLFTKSQHSNPYTIMLGGGIPVKVCLSKKDKRWVLDTDLIRSDLEYTDVGKSKLDELATQSEFSDGILLEQQTTKLVFQISMDDDLEEGLKYTVGVWITLLDKVLSDRKYVNKIML